MANAQTDEQLVGDLYGPCPKCGEQMYLVIGSIVAICQNCGLKDVCCD